MFSKEYILKYSDIDYKGRIKVSTILELLQDVSICHSANVGYDLGKMQEICIAMLLHGWHVKFLEPVDFDKPVVCKTGIMKVHRMEVHRKYEVYQDGVCKIRATAIWFSFNSHKKQIVRVPEEINEAYDTIEEENNGIEIARLRPSALAVSALTVRVTNRDLDTNNHMNNVKSVEAALDCLPDDMEVKELHVIYQKQLLKDEEIKICTYTDEEGLGIELKNSEDESCVLLYIV